MRLPSSRRRVIPLAAAGITGLALSLLAPGGSPAIAEAGTASGGIGPHQVSPIEFKAPFVASAPAALPTPAECLAEDGMACMTPTDIRSAYDIPDTIDGRPAGTGQTIMIVDAYGSPTAQADLDAFSTTMGIPSTTLHVFTPMGAPDWSSPDDDEYGWAGETSLDVQWAHAVAPGATIDLVVSPDDGDSVDAAMRWGLAHLDPDTMSMSYGDPEWDWVRDRDAQRLYSQDSSAYAQATSRGTTIFASAGDDWADNEQGFANFQTPADDANVVAVGGTVLNDGLDPTMPDQTVWNDDDACPYGCTNGVFGGTGGAPSLVTSKGGADVAYDASVYTGVLVYHGYFADAVDNGFYFSGGTSAGSPQWAALTADIDQAVGHDLGAVDDDLARWAAKGGLTDVTVGDNASPTYRRGFSAKRGWDSPTGYGTPDVGRLITLLSGPSGHGHPVWSGPHTSPAHRGRLH